MSYTQISLVKSNHIAVITLQRPEQLNAFTGTMGEEWSDAYRQCDADDDIRVIVVTGAGRAFCSGADMSDGPKTFDLQDDMNFSSCPVVPAWTLKKPVIAALNGHAIGLGFSLALQCDFRIVADNAKYGLLQVKRGVLADGCTHWLLPRLTNLETALELQLTGCTLNGREMVARNLARQSVPNDQVLETAVQFAALLAQDSSPLVAAMAKQLVWQGLHQSLQEAEQQETRVLHHSMGTADAIEGGIAYVERRTPEWTTSVNELWPESLDTFRKH